MSTDPCTLRASHRHNSDTAISRRFASRLGKRARKLFDNADEGKCAIYIPALALVELGEACRRERVALDLPLITRDPTIAATAGVECIWT
jgi:hypothetical protein